MSEPVLPEGLTAAQKREKYQEANEKAINTLDTLYEELRIKRIGAAARRRSAWVPHLKLAFEKGKLEKREKEKWRHELNLVRAGVVNGWIKQLEAVKESKVFHSESLDRFVRSSFPLSDSSFRPAILTRRTIDSAEGDQRLPRSHHRTSPRERLRFLQVLPQTCRGRLQFARNRAGTTPKRARWDRACA